MVYVNLILLCVCTRVYLLTIMPYRFSSITHREQRMFLPAANIDCVLKFMYKVRVESKKKRISSHSQRCDCVFRVAVVFFLSSTYIASLARSEARTEKYDEKNEFQTERYLQQSNKNCTCTWQNDNNSKPQQNTFRRLCFQLK